MNYLREIFIELEIQDFGVFIQKLVLFTLATSIIIWLTLLIIVKFTRFIKDTRENRIRFGFLKSLPIFLILFSVYFYFVIKLNGLYVFDWHGWQIYYNLSPHAIIYLTVIILFFIFRYRFYKNIKTT